MAADTHDHFMQLALELARKGEGRTAPNPPVGAVIVKDGQIVGQGFHPKAGQPHAEIFALRDAGDKALGATIYVTLEPCSHFGKTPPCADALIAAGIAKVVVGTVDPNPKVAGNGVRRLQDAGIDVEVGVLENACQRLIAPFKKHILTGNPFTIYKTAMTLDGNTATKSGDSKWISGEESRLWVHQLRHRVDAIMVGSETVRLDDPQLSTRLPEGGGHDPLRIVVDSSLKTDPTCRMLRQQSKAGTLIATTSCDKEKIAALEKSGAEVLCFTNEGGYVPLKKLWQELGRRNIQRLLLEGGSGLATAVLEEKLIDQLVTFIAPKIVGGSSGFGIFSGPGCEKMGEAIELANVVYQQSGNDLMITGDVVACLPD